MPVVQLLSVTFRIQSHVFSVASVALSVANPPCRPLRALSHHDPPESISAGYLSTTLGPGQVSTSSFPRPWVSPVLYPVQLPLNGWHTFCITHYELIFLRAGPAPLALQSQHQLRARWMKTMTLFRLGVCMHGGFVLTETTEVNPFILSM